MRLALFDWNGTSLNDLDLVYGSVRAIFAHYHVSPPPLEAYQAKITSNFVKFYHDHGIPESVSGDDMNSIRRQHFIKNKNTARLNPGLVEIIETLRKNGLRTGIVSAEIAGYLQERLSEFSITHLFDRVRDGAYNKTEAFVETLDFFGVKAEESFYVDDTFDGITAAKNLGIKAIGFAHSRSYNSQERIAAAKPDRVITTLFEIPALVEEWK